MALTPALKTGVAVARALRTDVHHPARLVVLDEPTATLPENEVRHLLDIVRRVAETGVGVLYVTHRLDEVFEVADHVTVFRDGLPGRHPAHQHLNRRSLVNLLIGSELDEIHAESEHLHSEHGDPILHVTAWWPGRSPASRSRSGRATCWGSPASPARAGRPLLSAIFGAQPGEGGAITVNGKQLQPQRPDLAMAHGLAYLPPDRKIQGAIMEFTARENLVITNLKPFWRGLRLRERQEVSETRTVVPAPRCPPVDGVSQRFSSFSGGNQQKILFGKWLRRTPLVLLLDEPTQGVDVGAKAELHRQLLAAAEEGAGLVISTSDLDELAALSHRVLVLRDGRIVARHLAGTSLTVATIARECVGAETKVIAS